MLGGDGGGKAGEGGWENGVGPLRGKPLFCLPDGGLFSACPAGATAQPLAAMPPYGWGVPPAGKTTFSFACKRKSGSGLRKRKGGPVEIITGYGTTERWRYAVMVSLG